MKIEINFFDYWHCGSGSSGGSESDLVVIRDDRGLPFVPGKTIKGHIREIAQIIGDNDFIDICLGNKEGKDGECYFSNAVIKESIDSELIPYLYKTISYTQIDEKGLAKTNSLREIEVVIPIKLYGTIDFSDNAKRYEDDMKKILKQIKRVGLNRNRGLGRCEISVVGDSND